MTNPAMEAPPAAAVVEEETLLSDLPRACLPTEELEAGLTKRPLSNTVMA